MLRLRSLLHLARRATGRPPKPYADFPLTPHPAGHWCKQIRDKTVYFWRWGQQIDGKLVRVEGDGWKAALDLYKSQVDDLQAGRTPRSQITAQQIKEKLFFFCHVAGKP